MSDKSFGVQVGETIRNARKQKKMTQEEIAEWLGVSIGTYRSIESGQTKITFENAVRLSMLLEMPLQTMPGQYYEAPELQNAGVNILMDELRRLAKAIVRTGKGKKTLTANLKNLMVHICEHA